MNMATRKFFNKHGIDLNVPCHFETKYRIVSIFIKDLNEENEEIKDWINSLSDRYESRNYYHELCRIKFSSNDGKVGASKRTKNYWIVRGWSQEEAIEKISALQRKNSSRCVEYWMERGHSKEEAIEKISALQTDRALQYKCDPAQRRKNSSRCVEYWMERGHSKEEAREFISMRCREYSLISAKKYSKEERRLFNPRCVEYWMERGHSKEEAIEKIISTKFYSPASKKAVDFCKELSCFFPNEKIYYHGNPKEFMKYSHETNRVYAYDFCLPDRKVIVEFHGNYWHSSRNTRYNPEYDIEKMKVAINHGFRYYVIWESEYDNDKNSVINLSEKIKRVSNENSQSN